MTWDVRDRNGIWLPQVGWHLDARRATARSFVSHAHSDHIARHREVILSPGTAKLMRARLSGTRVEHVLPFGHTEPLAPDVTVTLHPAGHILGSAMILLEHARHGRLLYTGDFKLRPGLSAETAETPRADVLIMETTFGRPQYVLPPTVDVLFAIVEFCRETLAAGEVPVLYGYSLGKSQEILRALAGAGLPVMVHEQVRRLTAVCAELGVTFPEHAVFDATRAVGHVVICPPQSAAGPLRRALPPHRTALISGWALDRGAKYRHGCDAAFALSDHADFPDLLRLVDLVRPRLVYTVHGFTREFAQTLRRRGVEAWALGRPNQLELELEAAAPAP
jgi:Cft2 family RNA processing exonuclease